MTIVIQEVKDMRMPKGVREWMKNHTLYDLEELLLDEKYSDIAMDILEMLSEMNGEDLYSEVIEEIPA
jgi:hypothetical protein